MAKNKVRKKVRAKKQSQKEHKIMLKTHFQKKMNEHKKSIQIMMEEDQKAIMNLTSEKLKIEAQEWAKIGKETTNGLAI